MTSISFVHELLRLREVQLLARVHTAGNGKSRYSDTGFLVLEVVLSLILNCFGWGAITTAPLVSVQALPHGDGSLLGKIWGLISPQMSSHKVVLMEIPMWLIQLLLGELQPPTVFVSDCHCPLK